MDYGGYRDRFFQDPMPAPRFSFQGSFGLSLFYMDFQEAVSFYSEVLGPPSYVEGKWTRGWPIGDGWLTLLLGKGGNPANIEIAFEMEFPADAEQTDPFMPGDGSLRGGDSNHRIFVERRTH